MRHWPVIAAAAAWFSFVTITSLATGEPIPASDNLAAPPQSQTGSSVMAEALAKFKANDFDGALSLWREAAKANADLPPAQVVMAQLYFGANMPDKAKAALTAATSDAPEDPEAYLLLGAIAVRDRDLAEAEAMLKKAEGLMASFAGSEKRTLTLRPQLHFQLAALTEARGDWAESQKQIEALLKLDRRNIAALQRLARVLIKRNEPQAALEKLREAVKIDGDLPAPEAILSQIYFQSKDIENADKWMAAAVAAAPKNLKTRLLASQFALETGNLDEARRQSIAATRIDGESLEAKLLQGEIANYEMNFEGAELFFDAVLKRLPDSLSASNNLALALISQDNEAKHRRALKLAEANHEKYPKMPQVVSTLGIVLYRLGRIDDAEKMLAGAVSLKESDPETAYVFARIAADRGHKAEAVRLLQISLKGIRPFMYRQEAEELLEELQKP